MAQFVPIFQRAMPLALLDLIFRSDQMTPLDQNGSIESNNFIDLLSDPRLLMRFDYNQSLQSHPVTTRRTNKTQLLTEEKRTFSKFSKTFF